jgi:integrase
MEILDLVAAANDRLRAARSRITIETHGKGIWLHLRGNLPPKPGQGARWSQQRIRLGVQAGRETIDRAEKTANLISAQLNLNKFDWADWIDIRQRSTVHDWVEVLEEKFWEKNDKGNPKHRDTWRVGYSSVLSSLPLGKELTADLLSKWVPARDEPGTRREHYVNCANKLSDLAGLGVRFENVGRSKPLQQRDLPSEEELIELYNGADFKPSDKWVLGVLIAYGLRGHELFGLDYSQYPELIVRKTAKTGSRIVIPFFPAGCDWDLSLYRMPDTLQGINNSEDWAKPGRSNSSYGTLISRLFDRREWPCHAYDLRHCFARRLKLRGIDEWLAAKLMGHQKRVHISTYQHSFGDRFYVDLVKAQLRGDR